MKNKKEGREKTETKKKRENKLRRISLLYQKW
jgi:hypothetical protein